MYDDEDNWDIKKPVRKTKNKKNMKKEIKEFLLESNAIEGVHGEEALEDALRAWNYISDKSF